jgi:hypothetical protein
MVARACAGTRVYESTRAYMPLIRAHRMSVSKTEEAELQRCALKVVTVERFPDVLCDSDSQTIVLVLCMVETEFVWFRFR